jgi:hypothetical protein
MPANHHANNNEQMRFETQCPVRRNNKLESTGRRRRRRVVRNTRANRVYVLFPVVHARLLLSRAPPNWPKQQPAALMSPARDCGFRFLIRFSRVQQRARRAPRTPSPVSTERMFCFYYNYYYFDFFFFFFHLFWYFYRLSWTRTPCTA